jgi:hypothetical protein
MSKFECWTGTTAALALGSAIMGRRERKSQLTLGRVFVAIFWTCLGMSGWAMTLHDVESATGDHLLQVSVWNAVVGLRFIPFLVAVGTLLRRTAIVAALGVTLWAIFALSSTFKTASDESRRFPPQQFKLPPQWRDRTNHATGAAELD